jgi:DNA-binding response OmpR family regulator
MAAGFDGYQGKPISLRELLATVRDILDKPERVSGSCVR